MWDLSIRVDPTFVGDKDNVINAHPVITPQKMTFQFWGIDVIFQPPMPSYLISVVTFF